MKERLSEWRQSIESGQVIRPPSEGEWVRKPDGQRELAVKVWRSDELIEILSDEVLASCMRLHIGDHWRNLICVVRVGTTAQGGDYYGWELDYPYQFNATPDWWP